jgi:lysophospholipase L1-like esterase
VEGGTDIIQGYAYEGTSAGTYIEAVVPTFQQYVRVWFMYQPGGGNFTVTVNGVAQPQQTTDLSYRASWSNLYQMLDDGSGKCTIRVTIDSGPTIICGFGYEKPVATSPATAGNVVQNFSQSGRRLYMATEGMIESACKGSMLILALGFNDHLDCDSDADYNAAFQQRIDWIIEYCLQYNTTLVVADFCWWATPDNLARQGLKRAAVEARGIYVPLPDYVTRDQLLKTEFYNPSYPTDGTDLLVTDLQMWVDGAHPNVYGQKWIAETVAKAMGLSCTSKEQALAHYDWAWPIQFDAASNFKNRFTAMPYLSFVRRNGSDLLFSLHFITKSGANISVGSAQVLSKALTAALSRQFVAYSTAQVTQQPIMLAGDGTVHVAVSMTLDCIISIRCVTASGTYVDGTFRAPFDHYN